MRILKSAQMSQSDHILDLARHRRVLRAADVREHGWSPQLLRSLYRAGKLQRVARDLYSLPDIAITAHRTLIEVRQRVPKAVLCLLSALQFHGLGTQMPQEVGVALPEATQPPALDYPGAAADAGHATRRRLQLVAQPLCAGAPAAAGQYLTACQPVPDLAVIAQRTELDGATLAARSARLKALANPSRSSALSRAALVVCDFCGFRQPLTRARHRGNRRTKRVG